MCLDRLHPRSKEVLIAAVWLAGTVLARGGEYAVTDLGAPAGYKHSYGMAINERGDVVSTALHAYEAENGNSVLVYRSFMHRGPSVTEILTLPGDSVEARDVNDSGALVGRVGPPQGAPHPFVWRDGLTTILPTLPGMTGAAFSINNAGQVVGVAEFPCDLYHAVLWGADGRLTDLGAPYGGWAVATAVNDAGHAVGWTDGQYHFPQGVLWKDGGATVLPKLPGSVDASAWDINDAGQVVGGVWPGSRGDAFVYREGVLTALPAFGGRGSCAQAINNGGQAVGWSDSPDGSHRAALWSNGVVVDLNTRIPANAGWQLMSARDINDAGQIVGTGWHDGVLRGFLLTPVPEPSGALMALLLGGMGAAGRRPRAARMRSREVI